MGLVRSLLVAMAMGVSIPVPSITHDKPDPIYYPYVFMYFPETIPQRIHKVLYDSGYSTRFTLILIAQARHESGNFRSKLARDHNNLWGMRHPVLRKTTSLGPLARAEGREGYASYRSIEDATRDIVLYHIARKSPNFINPQDYVTFLKDKRYFEASYQLYLNSINHWLYEEV